MIERELAHREVLATVLASVGIPREDVPAIEPQPAARHAVALGQPNHTRCLQVVAHRSHPVVVLSWLPALIVSAELGPELRELTPALERIGRILACLSMHYLGKLPKEKPDRAANIDHVHRHKRAVEHEHTQAQCGRRRRKIRGRSERDGTN